MSKPQGLFRRGNVWWYQRRIPRDLIHKFQGRIVLKESLGTQDNAQAKIRRNRAAAKFDAQFTAAKAASETQLPIAKDRSNAEILKLVRDYVRREDAKRAENYSSADWSAHPDALPSSLKRAAELIELYKDPSADVTWKAIVRAGEAILGTADILELEENWHYLHRAVLELQKRDLARMNGDYQHATYDHIFDGQPLGATTPVRKVTISLGDLVEQFRDDYAKTHAVGEKRIGKLNAALDLSIRFFGHETPISRIDRSRCREFRDILNELPSNISKRFPDAEQPLADIAAETRKRNLPRMATETQAMYLSILKQLLRWAQSEGHIDRDPAADLSPLGEKQAPQEARNPFTIEQLKLIFNAPLYRGCKDDGNGYAIIGHNIIRGTRFWVPLIGLYTGMRLNEICQLDVVDVQQSKVGVWYLSVNANSPDKLVKNSTSKRNIPVHADLIRIGFLKFVEQQKSKSAKLFPDLKRSERGYHSERMSRWFNEGFLPKSGAKTDKTSFHSFRHTFRDALRAIHAPPAVVQGLGGWRIEEGVSGQYGSGLSVDQLSRSIKRITFKGLDLSHLYID